MTAAEFQLRVFVREVIDGTDEADPGVIAGMVMSRLPRGVVRVALSQALRLVVRQVMSEGRATIPTGSTSSYSAKVTAIRDGWQRHLADSVHVGVEGWKKLRDCTYDDLLAAAAERRELAERNQARARQYDSWARLLTEHDVKTFGDLPVAVQAYALGGVAA